jgi:hypothetical protein
MLLLEKEIALKLKGVAMGNAMMSPVRRKCCVTDL